MPALTDRSTHNGAAAAAQRRARAAQRALEVEDSPRVLRDKCRRLARALRNAKHLVVYTGAGISTAADIPDYRGPRGVWTRLQRGETVGRVEVSRARPTFTHMALTALWTRGLLKFVASQNCDGLHLRAGLPRRALAELHGNMFAELCASCRRLYLRAFDTTERTARHRHGTRRLCHACGAELRDSIVHFGERGRAAWPLNWAGALRHAARADVVLCLGSSLKVLRRYPRLWRMRSAPAARPALFIVNLQWTPKDGVAALKINARCDVVMRQVARRLRLRVPRYRTCRDPLLAHAEPLAPPEMHTSRRPPLPLPSTHLTPASASTTTSSSSSSPSASDSDEEVPLGQLADKLRAPQLATTDVSSALRDLRAFTVRLHSGEARILLKTEHAPSPLLPLPPPHPPPVTASSPSPAHRSSTAELRSFRIRRKVIVSPDMKPCEMTCNDTLGSQLRRLLEMDVVTTSPDAAAVVIGPRSASALVNLQTDHKIKLEDDSITKLEPKAKDEVEEGAGSLAAAIIARAVLLCRASLYPGLHTIIASGPTVPGGDAALPPAPTLALAPSPSDVKVEEEKELECAWCLRQFMSRRCLWYGPARETPLSARVWRRVRARRYLCTCCSTCDTNDPGGGGGGDDDSGGEGGWYGKGYRKGRRRPRR